MAIAKKRQKFFDVDMPIINKETQLKALEIKELEGREIKYDLTRILKGKSIILKLSVKIKGEKATSTPKEIKVMPYFLKRAVRKGTNYVEDSFSLDCKNAQLRIKPLLVTRRRVSREVKKALRERAKEELIKHVKTKNSEEIFEEVLQNRLQKELSLKLKKIYPLSLCEIRVLKVEKELEGKAPEKKEVKKEKKE